MRLIAAAGLMLLGACNLADRRDDFAANNAAAPDNGAASREVQIVDGTASAEEDGNAQLALAPRPRRDPSGVDRDWFAGFWTDTGDCADAGQFGRDGRYRLADGTRGMWNVRSGQLVIENVGGRRVIRVRKVADDAVETINANGQASRSTRCTRVTPRAVPTPPTPVEAPTAPPPPPDLAD